MLFRNYGLQVSTGKNRCSIGGESYQIIGYAQKRIEKKHQAFYESN
jgi:hypothetical protein